MRQTTILTFVATGCSVICSCEMRSRPRIPVIEDVLQKTLSLQCVSSGVGSGGTRNNDKIESDEEHGVWVIPRSETNPDEIFRKTTDTIRVQLSEKGAVIVSSSASGPHGYLREFNHEGGNFVSHRFVYRFKGGLGFVDVSQATYNATEETGRIVFNHIFIPYPK